MIDLVLPVVASAIFFISALMTNHYLRRKNLRCVVLPAMSMIDIAKNIENNTEIYYKGDKVKNLSSYTIKIINYGFPAITKKHVRKPLQVVFDNKINILEHKIIDNNTSNDNFKISNDKNISTIEFDLLNRNNYVIIQYVYEGITEKKLPQIESHMENIKEIKLEDGIIKGSTKIAQLIFEGIFNMLFGGMILLAGLIVLLGIISIEFEVYDVNFYLILLLSVSFIITSLVLTHNGLRKLFKYKNCVIDLSLSGEKR